MTFPTPKKAILSRWGGIGEADRRAGDQEGRGAAAEETQEVLDLAGLRWVQRGDAGLDQIRQRSRCRQVVRLECGGYDSPAQREQRGASGNSQSHG